MSFNPEDTLKDFPCSFNLATGKKVSYQRLKHVKDNVIEDLECSDSSLEEMIRDLNLLTWALFCLDEKDEAIEKNNTVLDLTARKNITSLGNLIYISCRMGDKIKGSKIYQELLDLKQLDAFEELRTTAVAEQAYSCSRLGGHENYILSRDLFRQCTLKNPNNYLWKYGLGLACKRLTNWNIQLTSRDGIDVNKMRSYSVQNLFDVAENGDNRLKGLAYAQLVNLRQNCMHPMHDLLFNRHSILYLCTKALEVGENDPAVLTQCGKSIKVKDLERSIELLKNSLQLRESTTAYHHLGLDLMIKAKNEAKQNWEQSGAGPGYSTGPKNFRKKNFHTEANWQTLKYGEGSKNVLDRNNRLVQDAIGYFQKAIKVSHGENVPAILSLGDIYRSVKDFQSALAQYNQIIDLNGSKFNGSLRQAYTSAAECLLFISKDDNDPCVLIKEATELFIKAISLDTEFVSVRVEGGHSGYTRSTLEYILHKVSKLPPTTEQRFFELVRSYRNNTGVLRLILNHVLNPDDYETIKTEFFSLLDSNNFEGALALLNIAGTNRTIANSEFWSSAEIVDMRSRIYFAALLFRLINGRADSTRVFQQLFELRYGQCVGMVSEDDYEDTVTKYCDVVIVADDTTLQLAKTLCEIFKSVYGIDTVYRSKRSVGSRDTMVDRPMESCSLFLVLQDEDDDSGFETFDLVRGQCADANTLLLNWGHQNLNRDKSLNLNDDYWAQTRRLMASLEMKESLTRKHVIETLFQGNREALIRIFCFLVGEDFERRREYWFTSR